MERLFLFVEKKIQILNTFQNETVTFYRILKLVQIS